MDQPIAELLRRVQADLRAALDGALGARGLTPTQYAVLAALEVAPGSSNADLARRCFVTPQTSLPIVESLERRGLLARRPHPTHGKVLMAALTADGAFLVNACRAEVEAVEARMLRGLRPAGRATLRKLLMACAAALESP